MGNQFWFFEDDAKTIADVAAIIRRLGEDIKSFVIPDEARTKLLETLRRPDISKILSSGRVQWIWKDVKKLERIEDICHFLTNLSRVMEKEGFIQASLSQIPQYAPWEEEDLTNSVKIVAKPKRRKGRIHTKERAKDIVKNLPPEYKIKESEDIFDIWDALFWYERFAESLIKTEKPTEKDGLEEQFQEFTDLLAKWERVDQDSLFKYLQGATPEELEDWVAALEWVFSKASINEITPQARTIIYYSGVLKKTANLPLSSELHRRIRVLENMIRDVDLQLRKRLKRVEHIWDSLDMDERENLARKAGFDEDTINTIKEMTWNELVSQTTHVRFDDALRRLIRIIDRGYRDRPPEAVVETSTTDAGTRWNELDPEDRYKLALKAGFCDERARELSTLAWEGLHSMVKQDLDWVLKAAPEELSEVKKHVWNNIPISKGSLIVVKGKPAVVIAVGYDGGEPVVDYITGPGEEEQWAYLDQIQTAVAPEERRIQLKNIIKQVSDLLLKKFPEVDGMRTRIVDIIRHTFPFVDIDEIYYILQEYIKNTDVKEVANQIKQIVQKVVFSRISDVSLSLSQEKKEHFIAPMIPRGVATSGGAAYHGGGLEESERKWLRKARGALADAIKAGTSDEEIEKIIDELSLEYLKTGIGTKDHKEIKDTLWTFVGAISVASRSATDKPIPAFSGTAEAFPGQIPATGHVESNKESEMENDEENLDDIIKEIEDTVQYTSDINAAMAWSTPTDDMIEKFGEDVWVIATFGNATAVNGDPIDPDAKIPKPPPTHRLTNYGGEVPTAEEEIDFESIVHLVAKNMDVPVELVLKAADKAGYKPRHGMVYVSVSGDVEVYAKDPQEMDPTPETAEAAEDTPSKIVPPRLSSKKRQAVNRELSKISSILWDSLWETTDRISEVLKNHGLEVEDYIITGEQTGTKRLELRMGGETVTNSLLILYWYKHQSGRYEINVYLS